VKRMKGLRDSGIVDWWEKCLNEGYFNSENHKALRTKELIRDGQSTSLVIFVVLLIGN